MKGNAKILFANLHHNCQLQVQEWIDQRRERKRAEVKRRKNEPPGHKGTKDRWCDNPFSHQPVLGIPIP